MVSAPFLCLLAIGLTAASSQLLSSEIEFPDSPILERRTFKHGKPVKLLPLVKKHKKFGSFVPHVFSKTSYTEIPVIHETPKPIYKFHRYQGIEVKPVSDIILSTPEPIIETHSADPSSEDFGSSFINNHHLSSPVITSVLLYPVNNKPIFSAPPLPVYAPLPPPPPKPIYSFVPPPPQPVLSSLPITSLPPPGFSSISVPRPAHTAVAAPTPVFTPVPTSFPSNPPLTSPIFTSIPIKLQTPVLPPLPAPTSAPVFSSVPVKSPAPVLPPASSLSPSNIFSSISVKIPAPVLPSAPTSSTPAPIFSSISTVSPTPGPVFSSIPVSLPPPPQFSAFLSSAPSISAFPPPPPALSSISVSATPGPEFPYPPRGTPIPSYIKDISLGDIEIKDSSLPTIETPQHEEVTPASISDDGSKNLQHVLGVIKNENGFFQKIKDWKADKANAALSHFTQFKQKPSISFLNPNNKIPVEIPSQIPIYPPLEFPGPLHPLPLAPAPALFPPAKFFPPAKYENFPPNNRESSPLLNSYGAPISHDSYASTHVSHDRLSSAASEEEPAIVPAPSMENKSQDSEVEQRPIQTPQEFEPQNFQSQFQQKAISHDYPVYVPEKSPTVNEENKKVQEVQAEVEDYKTQKEPNSQEVETYSNHKE